MPSCFITVSFQFSEFGYGFIRKIWMDDHKLFAHSFGIGTRLMFVCACFEPLPLVRCAIFLQQKSALPRTKHPPPSFPCALLVWVASSLFRIFFWKKVFAFSDAKIKDSLKYGNFSCINFHYKIGFLSFSLNLIFNLK